MYQVGDPAMKIGDIDLQKTPPRQSIQCENGCSAQAIAYLNGTPFCPECLRVQQQIRWDADGQFFENNRGERIYYEVVARSTSGNRSAD
jgi:hypothetical protein